MDFKFLIKSNFYLKQYLQYLIQGLWSIFSYSKKKNERTKTRLMVLYDKNKLTIWNGDLYCQHTYITDMFTNITEKKKWENRTYVTHMYIYIHN